MANMAEKLVDKKYHREEVKFESNNRFTITSADQHYSFTNSLQILSKFLHSFRPVDLTAGELQLPLQPSINFLGGNYGR